MKFVILAVLLGIFIAFIVTVVKAAKSWRWYHITSAVIAMILAITLLFPTANVLKSRQAWAKVFRDLEAQLKSVEEDQRLLKFGDADKEGVDSLTQKLSKIGTEAGRRWRGLQFGGVQGNLQITLRLPAQPVVPGQPVADPAAAAQPTSPLVPVGMVVYGFGEAKFGEANELYPRAYLGEFKVQSSTPTSVILEPTNTLEKNQANIISGGGARNWSLYEMLPLDGHTPFIAEGSKPDDGNILGRVDEQLVNTLLKNSSPEILNDYLIDGQRGAPDSPAARWVKIRFDKKFKIDVDSTDQRGALEGSFFDVGGRAVDSRLQIGGEGEVSFDVGDVLVVKEEATELLIVEMKVATIVDTYYLRPLNDYRYVLRRVRNQIRDLEIRIENLNYEKKVLEATAAKTVDMLNKGQIEEKKLEEDVAQYEVENTALETYHGKVREELRQMKEASSALYRSNFKLLRQIEQLSKSELLTES